MPLVFQTKQVTRLIRDLVSKTEVGGVRLTCTSEAAVRQAFRDIQAQLARERTRVRRAVLCPVDDRSQPVRARSAGDRRFRNLANVAAFGRAQSTSSLNLGNSGMLQSEASHGPATA